MVQKSKNERIAFIKRKKKRNTTTPQQPHNNHTTNHTTTTQQSTVSWVRVVNGDDKSVTESMLTTKEKASNQFLYLRANQGHSRDNAVDPALQDNVLLPNGFTEYIYHVGNAKELNSIIRNGLIPGGNSLKRGRQAVFFTTVNPMEDLYGLGETPCDLTKPRIAPCKNTWKRLQNTVFLKLA